eukprot:m.155713 g.155713  ORF g.155713 m.155713 type:complete len:637 (+) comp10206_c0_seq1:236-2146(+)
MPFKWRQQSEDYSIAPQTSGHFFPSLRTSSIFDDVDQSSYGDDCDSSSCVSWALEDDYDRRASRIVQGFFDAIDRVLFNEEVDATSPTSAAATAALEEAEGQNQPGPERASSAGSSFDFSAAGSAAAYSSVFEDSTRSSPDLSYSSAAAAAAANGLRGGGAGAGGDGGFHISAQLQQECDEWRSRFTHLRVVGTQVCPTADHGVGITLLPEHGDAIQQLESTLQQRVNVQESETDDGASEASAPFTDNDLWVHPMQRIAHEPSLSELRDSRRLLLDNTDSLQLSGSRVPRAKGPHPAISSVLGSARFVSLALNELDASKNTIRRFTDDYMPAPPVEQESLLVSVYDAGGDDAEASEVEEVFAQDGIVEEFFAFDATNEDLTPKPRSTWGLPPVTPTAFEEHSIASEVFDHLWRAIIPLLRPVLMQLVREHRKSRKVELPTSVSQIDLGALDTSGQESPKTPKPRPRVKRTSSQISSWSQSQGASEREPAAPGVFDDVMTIKPVALAPRPDNVEVLIWLDVFSAARTTAYHAPASSICSCPPDTGAAVHSRRARGATRASRSKRHILCRFSSTRRSKSRRLSRCQHCSRAGAFVNRQAAVLPHPACQRTASFHRFHLVLGQKARDHVGRARLTRRVQ